METVYINMDSSALLSYRAKLTKEEAIATAEKRYVSAVYFHTLFLYTITKNRKYGIVQQREQAGETRSRSPTISRICSGRSTRSSYLISTRTS